MYAIQNDLIATLVSSSIFFSKFVDLLMIDRRKLLLLVWAASIVILVILTTLSLLLFPIKWGLGISITIWAVFFGVSGLLFLSQKVT